MKAVVGFLLGLMLGAGSLLAYGSFGFSESWGDCVVEGEVLIWEEYNRYRIDVAIHYVECEE